MLPNNNGHCPSAPTQVVLTPPPPLVIVPVQIPQTLPVPPKRRPGRPLKERRPPQGGGEHYGITPEPTVPHMLAEMICLQPRIFERLARLFNAYKLQEINLVFAPTEIRIYASDHKKNSSVCATLRGAALASYWCGAEVCLQVPWIELGKIWGMINSAYTRTAMTYSSHNNTQLTILAHDDDNGVEEEFKIQATPAVVPMVPLEDDSDYPLSFTWSAKYLKKRVVDVPMLAQRLVFKHLPGEPLVCDYEGNRSVTMSCRHLDEAKPSLIVRDPEATVIVTVDLDKLRPFSSANISDNPVTISLHNSKRMSFTVNIGDHPERGWTCTIKIFCDTMSSKCSDNGGLS